MIQLMLGLLLSTAWARTASACAMCLSASDETREAYYATTALLALLPVLLVVGFGLWVRRAARTNRWGMPAAPRADRGDGDRPEVPSHP
jgi:hypothetical protein